MAILRERRVDGDRSTGPVGMALERNPKPPPRWWTAASKSPATGSAGVDYQSVGEEVERADMPA